MSKLIILRKAIDKKDRATLGFDFNAEHPHQPAGQTVTNPDTGKVVHGGQFAPKKDNAKDVESHSEAVKKNLQHLGTRLEDWEMCPIKRFVQIDDDRGSKTVPEFDLPVGYKPAPSLYNKNSSQGECELCGHDIKNFFWIQNHKKKWIMGVGSECIKNFQEGESGEELAKKEKWKQQRDFAKEAISKLAELKFWGINKRFLKPSSNEYRYGNTWGNEKAKSIYDDLSKLTAKVTPEGQYKDDDANITRWFNKNNKQVSDLMHSSDSVIKELNNENVHYNDLKTNYEELVKKYNSGDDSAESEIVKLITKYPQLPINSTGRIFKLAIKTLEKNVSFRDSILVRLEKAVDAIGGKSNLGFDFNFNKPTEPTAPSKTLPITHPHIHLMRDVKYIHHQSAMHGTNFADHKHFNSVHKRASDAIAKDAKVIYHPHALSNAAHSLIHDMRFGDESEVHDIMHRAHNTASSQHYIFTGRSPKKKLPAEEVNRRRVYIVKQKQSSVPRGTLKKCILRKSAEDPIKNFMNDMSPHYHSDKGAYIIPHNGGHAAIHLNTSYGGKHDKVVLDKIETSTPGKGIGNNAMKHLTGLADKHGVHIGLTAEPVGAKHMNTRQLKTFYGNHGFKPLAGNSMLRQPSKSVSLHKGVLSDFFKRLVTPKTVAPKPSPVAPAVHPSIHQSFAAHGITHHDMASRQERGGTWHHSHLLSHKSPQKAASNLHAHLSSQGHQVSDIKYNRVKTADGVKHVYQFQSKHPDGTLHSYTMVRPAEPKNTLSKAAVNNDKWETVNPLDY
jgi:hypothetical protein